jgi:hypothetical protein
MSWGGAKNILLNTFHFSLRFLIPPPPRYEKKFYLNFARRAGQKIFEMNVAKNTPKVHSAVHRGEAVQAFKP